MRGPYGYNRQAIGAFMETAGEHVRPDLIREGDAFFMSLRDQITQPAPQNRLVVRPSTPPAVATWWQTTVTPLFVYFADWIKSGSPENAIPWAVRLAQQRRVAAQLGLFVLPSAFFDAVDAANPA